MRRFLILVLIFGDRGVLLLLKVLDILLGLFVSEANNEKVQVTVKITLGGLNDIIQTFRRYNYEIISEHHEDNYMNNLKERSEYLDKYLNM